MERPMDLKAIVAEIHTENAARGIFSSLEMVGSVCDKCKKEFETWQITVAGREHRPLLCSRCDDMEQYERTVCDKCKRVMIYASVYDNLSSGLRPAAYVCSNENCEAWSANPSELIRAKWIRERWESVTPEQYRNTKRDQLPIAARVWYDDTGGKIVWKNLRGVYIKGISGLGKTRLGYMMLWHCITQGCTVAAIRADDFCNRISSLSYSSLADMNEFISHLSSVDVLLLDDFGRGVMTRRVLEGFYTLLEQIMSKNNSIIVTANESAGAIINYVSDRDVDGKIPVSLSSSLERRIKDSTTYFDIDNLYSRIKRRG